MADELPRRFVEYSLSLLKLNQAMDGEDHMEYVVMVSSETLYKKKYKLTNLNVVFNKCTSLDLSTEL